MKKRLLLLTILLCTTVSLFAQNYQEVIYFKNGSTIKGIVIEQIPNLSLTVKTPDGSIFTYQISEIDKITKELIIDNQPNQYREEAWKHSRGYKKFTDIGYSFGQGDFSYDRLEISSSFGYQFNHRIFFGIGTGVNYYLKSDIFTLPIFADFKFNFGKKNVMPFAEFKLGYTIGDIEGVYFAPAIGLRFRTFGNKAINVKLGYTIQRTGVNARNYNNSPSFSTYHFYRITQSLEAATVKVGFEF